MFAALVFSAQLALSDAAVTKGLNNLRAQKGLSKLSVSKPLQRAAEDHAREMYTKGYFDHRGANGSTVGSRTKHAGYRWCIVAENIAKGQKSAAEVMSVWTKSPGHLKNMALRQARDVGVAHVGDVWVMLLAAKRC
ncbi:CAP domain-containing protein [Sulfitobacter sp. SK012]|nr:CAP domain-containing protein [Sulfitobacter sp. SK012]